MTAQHLILAIIVLQVLDAASTVYFLQHTTLTEANPILAKLFELVEPLIVLLSLKGVFAVGIWMYQDSFAFEALMLVVLVYVAVVFNNIRLIRNSSL